MADSIDMSLDDFIKKNNIGRGRGGPRRSGRGGPGAGGRRPFRDGGNRGRGARRGGGGGNRNPMKSPYRRGDADGSWSHDMYEGEGRSRPSFSSVSSGMRESGSGKLVVSNLDFGVSDSDIHELFSEFGRLKSAAVHYDRSGRSLGSADIIYEKRSDAIRALKQYNGVPLDGRAMNIEFATSEVSSRGPPPSVAPRRSFDDRRGFQDRRSSRGRVTKPSRSPGGPRGRGGRRGGRGGREKRPEVSKEDLDKELDSYLQAR